MATKFVLSTEHDDEAALFALALATMSGGAVNVQEAVLVQVDSPVLADALGQLLDATGRVYTRVEAGLAYQKDAPEAMVWHSEFTWTDSVCGPKPEAETVANLVPPGGVIEAAEGLQAGLNGDSSPAAEAAAPAGKPKKQRVVIEPRTCPICEETYPPKRKDQTNCGKPECKKAMQKKWQAAWDARQGARAGEATDVEATDVEKTGGEAISDGDLREAEALVQELEAEWAVESPDDAAGTPDAAQQESAVAADAAARAMVNRLIRKTTGGEMRVWHVETGPREGEWLTSHELSVALQLGNMRVGQVLKHRDGSLKRVYKPVGKSYQKLMAIRE